MLGRPGPNHKLRSADFVLVNKMDLLEHLDFDLEQFRGNLEVVNPGVNSNVIRRVRDATNLPVAAYNVSGEYSMLKAAAQNGWLDEERAVSETLTG